MSLWILYELFFLKEYKFLNKELRNQHEGKKITSTSLIVDAATGEIQDVIGENPDDLSVHKEQLSDVIAEKLLALIQEITTDDKNQCAFLGASLTTNDGVVAVQITEGVELKQSVTQDVFNQYHTPAFVAEASAPYNIIYGNEAFYKAFGGSRKQFYNIYHGNLALTFPMTKRDVYITQIESNIKRKGFCEMDAETECQSSSEWYYLNLQKIDSEKKPAIYGVAVPINHRVSVAEQLEKERKYFIALQELTKNELFTVDLRTWTFYNKNSNLEQSILPEEIHNFPQYIKEKQLIHPFDVDSFEGVLDRARLGFPISTALRFRINPDEFTWTQIDTKPILDEDGEPTEIIGVLCDAEDNVALKERATTDALTGVLNKSAFRDAVNEQIKDRRSNTGHSFLFLDIDDFKYVNDNLGHDFGDFLLKLFSQRLRHCLRDYDLVGRVGGDEFTILIKGLCDEEILQRKADALLENIRREYVKEDTRHIIKASIGIARFPKDGDTYDELYKKADIALYESKKKGKNVATIHCDTDAECGEQKIPP